MKVKKGILNFIIMFIVIAMSISLAACSKGGNSGTDPVPNPPEIPITEITYNYNYNEATGNNGIEKVVFDKEIEEKNTLIIPTRTGYEFDGWYSDWYFRTKVADSQGSMLVDKDKMFDLKSNNLFAKWKNDNAPIYPILMVFVTEVDAVLKTIDGVEFEVKYSMKADERKACEMIAVMLEEYLNAMLNGAVNFEVTQFFTTNVIHSRSFAPSVGTGLNGGDFRYSYSLDAYNIPELGGMEWPEVNGLPPISEIEDDGILSKYKSIITTFSLNDNDENLHFVGGSSSRKYAGIHMETLFSSLINQGNTIESLFDFNAKGVAAWWDAYMELYLHEYTHSVELYLENLAVNPIDYHDSYRYYRLNGLNGGQSGSFAIEFIRLYLLNRVKIDEIPLGIPESFWFVEK